MSFAESVTVPTVGQKRLVIIGASGIVGGYAIRFALDNLGVNSVTSIGRKKLGISHFNGRLRDECLNANWFTSLSDARRKIETWRQDYNEQRPHSSLNYLPPAEFVRTRAEMRA